MLNLQGPIWVYDNWGLYEPTTIVNTPVTEEMSLRQVREIARLQKHGVRFDYYMMNAFWYTPGSAYREWNKEHWPNGPDRWIQACQEIGVKPGMWFAPNLLWKNRVAPAWQDSYSGDAHRPYGTPMDGSLSFFEGGFLADFMQALEHWYGRGIRLFELDMLDLQAATPASRAKLSKDEIRERNKAALMAALAAFRQKCPEAVIVGFNGFNFSLSIHPVDVDWLKVLETCYAGDLRVTNVPHSSYWRATDYFGDERTRLSEENGVPLHRIDGCSIVLSQTSFVDFRQAHAWKGMFLQAVARGGWKQTVYGAIDLIRTDEDARWLARLQKLYDPLLKGGTKSFGPRPVADKPDREPYGYVSSDSEGAVYTIINPANAVREIQLESPQGRPEGGRVLFRDAGYVPVLDKGALTLGPGQMAVVGFGPLCRSGLRPWRPARRGDSEEDRTRNRHVPRGRPEHIRSHHRAPRERRPAHYVPTVLHRREAPQDAPLSRGSPVCLPDRHAAAAGADRRARHEDPGLAARLQSAHNAGPARDASGDLLGPWRDSRGRCGGRPPHHHTLHVGRDQARGV
jgi:hypothetical protein